MFKKLRNHISPKDRFIYVVAILGFARIWRHGKLLNILHKECQFELQKPLYATKQMFAVIEFTFFLYILVSGVG